MPRFITVTVGCDWDDCTTTGVEGEGTVVEKTLSIDNKAPRTFLICKTHLDQLDEIHEMLMAKGVKAEGSPSPRKNGTGTGTIAAGGVECKECGRTDIKNKAGLAQHVIRSHKFKSLADYKAKHHIDID